MSVKHDFEVVLPGFLSYKNKYYFTSCCCLSISIC